MSTCTAGIRAASRLLTAAHLTAKNNCTGGGLIYFPRFKVAVMDQDAAATDFIIFIIDAVNNGKIKVSGVRDALQQFRVCIKVDQLMEDQPPQYKEVEKLNGAKHYGLIILEPGNNIAPTLYLEPFFDMYLHTKNWKGTVDRIVRAYQADSFPKRLDMGWFKDYQCGFRLLINFNTDFLINLFGFNQKIISV